MFILTGIRLTQAPQTSNLTVYSLAVMKEIPSHMCMLGCFQLQVTNQLKLIKQAELCRKLMESPEVGWALEKSDPAA